MRCVFTLFFFFLCSIITAQKKLLIDLNIGLLTPIGNNELKTFESNINPFTIQYYHRKKLQHPSVNVLIGIKYPVTKKTSVGIKSGIYLRFKEMYTSTAQRTSIFLPLQLTTQYNLFTINNKWLAINAAAGMLFFDFADFERYHNSSMYNVSFSYPISGSSSLQIGMEKEADRVSLDVKKFNESLYKDEIFKYKINRLFFHISYSIAIR